MKKLLLLIFSMALLVLAVGQSDATIIESRQIFYNYSVWDVNNASINLLDDAAIATDKSALLPGQTSTFANFTSYNLGINGIMIDLSGLASSTSLSDFSFLIGNNSDVNTWVAAPTPTDFAVRSGAGVSGSDRLTIIWNNYAIENQWLQITALTTLGLATPDVFYFGNLVGDVTGDGQVTPIDSLAIINAISNYGGSYITGINDPFDINRDGWISPFDVLLVNNILNSSGSTSLEMFTTPEANMPVPEPTTMLLLASGLVGLAGFRRRFRKK